MTKDASVEMFVGSNLKDLYTQACRFYCWLNVSKISNTLRQTIKHNCSLYFLLLRVSSKSFFTTVILSTFLYFKYQGK